MEVQMLAVLSLIGFIAVNGPVPAKDVDKSARELAQVFEQARHDFEVRHAELGLLGTAPLAGKEPAQPLPNAAPPRQAESSRATVETPCSTAAPKRPTGSH
jgi:hypothetical protein